MRQTDYILSYLYPVTVELTNSQWNPVLEVMLSAGKYSLNSENTNYSFGSLHTLFEKTFRKLKLNWNEINDVLILGFGTGSIVEIIGKYKQDCNIEGVEIDNKVIELGERYFHTTSLKNVTIHCASADLYRVKNALKTGGLVVFNKFVYSKTSREQISCLEKLYEKTFKNLKI